MKLSIFILSILILSSCGKSPFLKNSEKDGGTPKGTVFESDLRFSTIRGTQSDSSGNDISKSLYKVNGVWQIGPNLDSENKLLIIVSDEQGDRVDLPLTLDPYIWMPDMGHGSFPIKLTRIGDGIYELSEIFFTMGGYWDFHIEFRFNDLVVEEILWPINL